MPRFIVNIVLENKTLKTIIPAHLNIGQCQHRFDYMNILVIFIHKAKEIQSFLSP